MVHEDYDHYRLPERTSYRPRRSSGSGILNIAAALARRPAALAGTLNLFVVLRFGACRLTPGCPGTSLPTR